MLDSTALTTKTQERGAPYGGAIPWQPGRVRETGVENEEWLFLPGDTKNSHGRQA